MRNVLAFVVLSAAAALPAFAQDSPAPPVIQIGREAIKEGKAAAHEKVEAEYVRAFRKGKFPGYYYALSAISGSPEVWFISPLESFAQQEEFSKATQKDPLKTDIEMAESHDGLLRESSRTMYAVFREDMSYRPEKMNIARAHFFTLSTYRLRLGHEEDLMSGAKSLLAAYAKANVDTSILCYQVVSGAPNGMYLFFSPLESLQVLDGLQARGKALREAMGPDNYSKLIKGTGDTFLSIESTYFEMKPGMSYVSKSVEDADPAFWKPKVTAKPATAAASKEASAK